MKVLSEIPEQIFCTDNTFAPRDMGNFITDPVINKPHSGFWTSSKYNDAPFISAWAEWCANNDFPCGRNHFLLKPKKNIKVFEPEKIEDLRTHPPALPMLFPYIDFAWYAQMGYDGFHVSEKALSLTIGAQRIFYAWNCESTFWFNYTWIDCVEKIK